MRNANIINRRNKAYRNRRVLFLFLLILLLGIGIGKLSFDKPVESVEYNEIKYNDTVSKKNHHGNIVEQYYVEQHIFIDEKTNSITIELDLKRFASVPNDNVNSVMNVQLVNNKDEVLYEYEVYINKNSHNETYIYDVQKIDISYISYSDLLNLKLLATDAFEI